MAIEIVFYVVWANTPTIAKRATIVPNSKASFSAMKEERLTEVTIVEFDSLGKCDDRVLIVTRRGQVSTFAKMGGSGIGDERNYAINVAN